MVSTNYVDAEYIEKELLRCIQHRAARWKGLTFILVAVQFIGWMIRNEISKWLPFSWGLSVFMMV